VSVDNNPEQETLLSRLLSAWPKCVGDETANYLVHGPKLSPGCRFVRDALCGLVVEREQEVSRPSPLLLAELRMHAIDVCEFRPGIPA
jgi:hypothetical protein